MKQFRILGNERLDLCLKTQLIHQVGLNCLPQVVLSPVSILLLTLSISLQKIHQVSAAKSNFDKLMSFSVM